MYYIGLMSGTSADAIDAAALDVPASDPPRLLGTHQEPLPPDVHAAIHQLTTPSHDELERMGKLGVRLGGYFARAALAIIEKNRIARADVRAIGCHGQTIRHRPGGTEPYTLQIGEPAIIVEETGITTVAHFRSRDLAAGGEGAPLVPAFHQAVFRSNAAARVIVNIGGIANVTFLPKDQNQPVIGFDTGPGNTLLDQWINKHQNLPFDRDGKWARTGRVDPKVVQRLLADPYFSRRHPKSTGREYFNLEWLVAALGNEGRAAPEDVQASLLRLTVESIVDAVGRCEPRPDEIYLCGGGASNSALVEALVARAAPLPVRTTDALGFPAQSVEAAAFAWLAHRAMEGHPGNLPDVTGARHPVVMGAIYRA
jgi:anhydro-N-acetylmuramic acid kinase